MKKNLSTRSLPLFLSGLVLIGLASCTPYQQQGAAIGALGGAGLGAIVGDDTNGVITGAALGAAAGTGVTAYQEEQQRRTSQSYNSTRTYTQPSTTDQSPAYTLPPPPQQPTSQPQPPSQPKIRATSNKYPVATEGRQANTVISPYPPYNTIDIEGFKSGDKLCDPSTIPIDPATGKQYLDPTTGREDVKRGKYFIVP